MTDNQKTDVLPAKCGHCSRELNTPLFCDYCHTLNPPTGVADHFQLFGLPRRFELDEHALHDSYVALSRHVHPDFHQGDSPEVQGLAMGISASVNDAYRTLSDPVARAAYLLELLGGPSSAADKSVPDGFLNTMVMLQEELAEARAANNAAERTRLTELFRTQHAGLLRRVAALFAELDQAAGCEATRQDLLHEIRRQLNALSYVRKMMSLTAAGTRD